MRKTGLKWEGIAGILLVQNCSSVITPAGLRVCLCLYLKLMLACWLTWVVLLDRLRFLMERELPALASLCGFKKICWRFVCEHYTWGILKEATSKTVLIFLIPASWIDYLTTHKQSAIPFCCQYESEHQTVHVTHQGVAFPSAVTSHRNRHRPREVFPRRCAAGSFGHRELGSWQAEVQGFSWGTCPDGWRATCCMHHLKTWNKNELRHKTQQATHARICLAIQQAQPQQQRK